MNKTSPKLVLLILFVQCMAGCLQANVAKQLPPFLLTNTIGPSNIHIKGEALALKKESLPQEMIKEAFVFEITYLKYSEKEALEIARKLGFKEPVVYSRNIGENIDTSDSILVRDRKIDKARKSLEVSIHTHSWILKENGGIDLFQEAIDYGDIELNKKYKFPRVLDKASEIVKQYLSVMDTFNENGYYVHNYRQITGGDDEIIAYNIFFNIKLDQSRFKGVGAVATVNIILGVDGKVYEIGNSLAVKFKRLKKYPLKTIEEGFQEIVKGNSYSLYDLREKKGTEIKYDSMEYRTGSLNVRNNMAIPIYYYNVKTEAQEYSIFVSALKNECFVDSKPFIRGKKVLLLSRKEQRERFAALSSMLKEEIKPLMTLSNFTDKEYEYWNFNKLGHTGTMRATLYKSIGNCSAGDRKELLTYLFKIVNDCYSSILSNKTAGYPAFYIDGIRNNCADMICEVVGGSSNDVIAFVLKKPFIGLQKWYREQFDRYLFSYVKDEKKNYYFCFNDIANAVEKGTEIDKRLKLVINASQKLRAEDILSQKTKIKTQIQDVLKELILVQESNLDQCMLSYRILCRLFNVSIPEYLAQVGNNIFLPKIQKRLKLKNISNISPEDINSYLKKLKRIHKDSLENAVFDILELSKVKDIDWELTKQEIKAKQVNIAQKLGIPLHYKIKVNQDTSIEFVLIPPGKFVMGEMVPQYRTSDRRPLHVVVLTQPFYMGKSEITRKQWFSIMGKDDKNERQDFPIKAIPWKKANAFCKKVSVLSGLNVRLPSEAEWEYCRRGGSSRKYYWGDMMIPGKENFLGKGGDDIWDLNEISPVMKFPPNPFGLYDIIGNLRELCLDYYDKEFYKKSPVEDPINLNSHKKKYHIYRSGGIYGGADPSRRASVGENQGFAGIGFRVLLELEEGLEVIRNSSD